MEKIASSVLNIAHLPNYRIVICKNAWFQVRIKREVGRSLDSSAGLQLFPLNPSKTGAMGTQTDDFDYLPPLNDNTALVNSHDIEAPVAPVSARAAAGTSIPANNYFQRMVTSVHPYTYSRQLNPPAQRFTEPGPPIFRSGRLGAPWRHIRQCTGNRGDHICFIDGVVKTEDMQRYPPFGYLASVKPASYMPASYAKRPGGPLSASAGSLNQFREHAKQGFKYWYEEKTPMAAPFSAEGGRMKLILKRLNLQAFLKA
ncbi:hypothetical protein CAPTEDRAFT_206272 [Capitella teleta]|uniref:Uncharacterized protein n=1 Tax=Capitella teleta TaxID=283909 RepID=R7T7B0_CAPTE|nr:hypothetical protein CAPTEDRAFT_206272 [Capitella teleta]|eukprot:ELT89283.1 hypothetical protein CAPTEDRAFT_206272 [Capitella teleta]